MIKKCGQGDWLEKLCNTSYLLQHLLRTITNARDVLTNSSSSRTPIYLNHVLDVSLGIVFYQAVSNFLVDIDVDSKIMSTATFVKDRLDSLLCWLMGAPAGLKLNNELSSFLGNFFLFHVQIWMAYLLVIKTYFPLAIRALLFSNHLGLSIFLAFLNDIVDGLTFHLHCFYVYAASLYRVQLKTLLALARLFRGKKWNVLRLRVDSVNYRADQLILGTILFTILLFLLPTVALYYSVFMIIHCFVLLIQYLVMLFPSAISELKLILLFVVIEAKHESKKESNISGRFKEILWKVLLGDVIRIK